MSVSTIERPPVGLEFEPGINPETAEAYANSLSTLRTIGAIAIGDVVAINPDQAHELGFEDFSTAVAEMLKTDKEFREGMEVNNSRQFAFVDGKTRNKKGKPMVDVIGNGANLSAKLAEEDVRYAGQAERDACDQIVASEVDSLQPGESLLAVSYYPKDDLLQHPEIYKDTLGYEENLAYIQIYSKSLNDTVTASSLSIEITNETEARKVLAEHGINIPENESSNKWLLHFTKCELNTEQAKAKGAEIRKDYYRCIGRTTETISVNKYIEDSEGSLRYFYDMYYPSIGIAVHTGKNSEILQSFASNLLQGGIKLKPEVRAELMKIANSSEFTDEQGHMMNSILRYAVAEEMRKGLVTFKQKAKATDFKQTEVPVWRGERPRDIQVDPSMVLVQNIKSGVEAGRDYRGCAGNISLGEKDRVKETLGGTSSEAIVDEIRGKLQEAFGGQDSETWEWKLGVCRIKGCKTRPGKTKVGPCNICKSCTEKDNRGTKLEDAGDDEPSEKQEHAQIAPIIDMSKWKKDHEQPAESEHAEPIAA